MIVYYTRGSIAQKKRFEDYINDIFNHFFPNDNAELRVVNICFKNKCDGDAAGYCYADGEDEIHVEVAKSSMGIPYSLDEVAVNLAHELVHAKQHVEGKGNQDDHLPYWEKPSEIEAYALETVLAEKYWYK